MTGIKFPGSSLVMDLGRHVGLPELRRIRRQFTNINKQHTNYNVSKLNDSFIEYIISQL